MMTLKGFEESGDRSVLIGLSYINEQLLKGLHGIAWNRSESQSHYDIVSITRHSVTRLDRV